MWCVCSPHGRHVWERTSQAAAVPGSLDQMYVCMPASCAVRAEIQELLPGILNQMGPDSLQHLKKMVSQVREPRVGEWRVVHTPLQSMLLTPHPESRVYLQMGGMGGMPGMGGGMPNMAQMMGALGGAPGAAAAGGDDDGEACAVARRHSQPCGPSCVTCVCVCSLVG